MVRILRTILVALGLFYPLAADADPVAFDARLSIEFGGLAPVVATASGTLEGNTAPRGGRSKMVIDFTLPSAILSPRTSVELDPPYPLIGSAVQVERFGFDLANGPGSFVVPTSALGTFVEGTGAMGLVGKATALLVTPSAATSLRSVPLTGVIGASGAIMTKFIGIVPVQMSGGRFTTRTVSALSRPFGTPASSAQRLTRKGSFARSTFISYTERFKGPVIRRYALSYVSPTQIQVTGLETLAVFSRLDLTLDQQIGFYVAPEPSTAVLVGGGLVGMAWARRRRLTRA